MSQPQVPVVVFNDTRIDRHHGCQRVMEAIEQLLAKNGLLILKYSPAHHHWMDDPDILSAVERAKLLIVNGEGTIHHDREAGRRLLEVGTYAKRRGIPSALINAGWEANGRGLQELARDFSLVSVRDSASAAELSQAGLACRVVPDLSLYPDTGRLAKEKVSGIGCVDCVNRFTALEIDRLCRVTRGRTLSIHLPEPGLRGYLGFIRQGIAKADLAVPATMAKLVILRHRIYSASTEDTAYFLQQLSQVQLLVSGRFHACTLALLTDTPFLAQASNTRKIASLIRDCGLEEWRCKAGLHRDDVREAMNRGWSEQERDAIQAYVASARSAAEGLFQDMRALVS